MPCGERPRSLGVVEHIGVVEPDLTEQFKCLLMVLLCLGAEPGDHVRGDSAARQNLPDHRHTLKIPLGGVASPHLLQKPVAARLDRQMNMIADVVVPCHRLDQLVTDVLGMIGGETHSQLRADPGDHLQQFRKVTSFPLRRFPVVGIHVLTEQGDFLVPFAENVTGFIHNGLRISASFRAPGVRNHAIRADIVASPHDRDER